MEIMMGKVMGMVIGEKVDTVAMVFWCVLYKKIKISIELINGKLLWKG